ncbi:fibulin-1 isoform X1 [Tachysurus ichikawai]
MQRNSERLTGNSTTKSLSCRPRVDRSDIIRCIKSCQPNDITCVLDPVHSVSHTVISLPTFREFTKPEEIVFLRSITPSHYPHVDSPEIVYDIQEGNVQNSFDIIKRFEHGMIVGDRDTTLPALVQLMIGLKSLLHLLWSLQPLRGPSKEKLFMFCSSF